MVLNMNNAILNLIGGQMMIFHSIFNDDRCFVLEIYLDDVIPMHCDRGSCLSSAIQEAISPSCGIGTFEF